MTSATTDTRSCKSRLSFPVGRRHKRSRQTRRIRVRATDLALLARLIVTEYLSQTRRDDLTYPEPYTYSEMYAGHVLPPDDEYDYEADIWDGLDAGDYMWDAERD